MGKGISKSTYKEKHDFDFDFLVIGGGSGGLAAAKEASELGKTVCVCDFVVPSPLGTHWGIGGTCVNVGCIPKKLMHQAALLEIAFKDSISHGWTANGPPKHNWVTLRDNIEFYIRSLNFGIRTNLSLQNITYHNAYAQLNDRNTVLLTDKKNSTESITASQILIAVGARPKYLDIPGGRKEDALCITSDDIFSLPKHPGKVLCVGASYIAVECAGFLVGIGVDTTMMVRSSLLRGFDNDMADKVQESLLEHGVKVLIPYAPQSIEKVKDGLKVTASHKDSGEIVVQTYNTVLLAIGRDAHTTHLDLDNADIKINSETKKIIVDKAERTSASNIYAIGDCAEGRPELTPPAIKAGQLLARRIFSKSKTLVNYDNIASVVYAPMEYGFVGLSEEVAVERYGKDKVEIYLTIAQPLEFVLPGRNKTSCMYKIIALKKGRQKILGMHYIGPNAGEVIQGFSTAIRLKATKQDLNMTVGIHPTCAEIFVKMREIKGGGISTLASQC